MAKIHHGVQARLGAIPLGGIEEEGLAGVLLGPVSDPDAGTVEHVIFTTDPSKTWGEREASESDPHALTIAMLNNWIEVNQDGSDIPEDQDDIDLEGVVRVIMGRNKDKYEGESAFTFEEARALLPPDTRFATHGGYLFSDRPKWLKPYGEPAIVVTLDDPKTFGSDEVEQLFALARGLSNQHRFVLESPWYTEVFEAFDINQLNGE